MTQAPDGRPLIGEVVRLDRLVASDIDPLYAAIGNEQVYAGGFSGGIAGMPADADEMRAQWEKSAADRFAYVVRLAVDSPLGAAGTVVGTTSLGDVDLYNESVHLGWTGYAPSVWGTAVNPATKLLLLQHAFEDCGFGRVAWKRREAASGRTRRIRPKCRHWNCILRFPLFSEHRC